MSRLHFLRTRAQFDAAHARWEEPPDDDGLTDCPVCDARGWVNELDEDNKPWRNVCPCCGGAKFLDEDGQPYDRDALQKLCEGE